jgi:hypothetical protein
MVPDGRGLGFPAALAEAFEVGFSWDYDEETDEATGCDFEPYAAFEPLETTAWWFRLWTGNPSVTGEEFRFFGTTGAGDYAGFWLVRPGLPLADQPVVFVGSEGERGVIARDLGDLLWLFAAGLGPREAFDDPSYGAPSAEFAAVAERYAPGSGRSAAEIVGAARAEFAFFSDYIDSLCR